MDKPTIQQLITHLDKGIVAVGTTAARTLESLYRIGNRLFNNKETDFAGIAITQWEPYDEPAIATPVEALQTIINWLDEHGLPRLVTRTQIIIAPGYDFKIIRGLITNFHQPQSTLLLLIAAVIGNDWRKVYDYALAHQYRFLSYGDGCLLWNNK